MSSMQRIGTLCSLPLSLALALALAGCSLARPPQAAPAEVPAQWTTPLPRLLPHDGSEANLADWWRQMDDPLLVDIVEAAEQASPNVASAAARVAEARATRIAAGAAMLPTLDAVASAQRSNNVASAGLGASSLGSGDAVPYTTLSAGLQSSWEIDLFGGLDASRDAAVQRESSAQAKWHDARVAVAAEAANAYFAERACVGQLRVAESDTRSRTETARLTGLSAEAGFTAPADAALARASAAEGNSRLTQQRALCDVQRKALVQLTGLDDATLEQKLAQAPAQPPLPQVAPVDRVPAQLLAQRPDVYAAQLAVAAASAEVGSAQADRYPKLSLTGNISRIKLSTAGFSQSLDTWTIGPLQLTLPLFDGGRRVANIESAKARYTEAASAYRANVRQAVREVEEALINLQSTDARTNDANTAVTNYQASFDATRARTETGLASLFELEDARRALFASQTARVALASDRAQAWVALYRAMGGGWQRPTDAAPLALADSHQAPAAPAPSTSAAPAATR